MEMMWKRETVMATVDTCGRRTWQWTGTHRRALGAVGHKGSMLRA